MAGAVITDQGLKLRLAATLDRPLFVRLFRNDVPVLPGSTLDVFTTAAFPGYADLELTGLWTAPVIDALGRAFSIVANLTWTRGPGGITETEYGWIVYENPDPDSVMVCGRRLTIPAVMVAEGNTVVISIIAYLIRG